MVIMGIDPGTATTGYGLVEKQGNKVSCITCGVINTDKAAAMPDRLLVIYTQLNRLLDTHEPDVVAADRFLGALDQGPTPRGRIDPAQIRFAAGGA